MHRLSCYRPIYKIYNWESQEDGIQPHCCLTILRNICSIFKLHEHVPSVILSNNSSSSLRRSFQEYVDCMYPAFMCPSLLKGFWTNYEAYKRPPYRCRPRNGTALPKHYKFTMDAPSNSGLGYTCVANHVVTITAVTILASHIQIGDI